MTDWLDRPTHRAPDGSTDGVITAIEPQRRHSGRRVNVFVDGRYAFSLEQELAGLVRVGQPLSELATAELLLKDEHARAYEAALAFLAHRPRSEREVRDRLARNDVPPATLESVLDRLRRLKLLDDLAFARYWVEQRQTHRPRGSRLLRQELLRKGIESETAGEVLEAADGEDGPVDAACRAARRKAQSLRLLDEREFAQRLGQFLVRRGFDYETARSACRQLWSELRV